MIKGEKAYLDEVVKNHICPEHGNKLVVAWHAGENSHVIRCGEGHFPEEVTRELTRTQQFKAGQLQKVDPMFNLLSKTDLATGELLPPEMLQLLVTYARKYALDAYRGHVVIMYGKPYISLDGYLYHANRSRLPYGLCSRPLDNEERVTYRVGENDHAWTCEVILPEGNQSFVGLGIVTQKEMTEMSTKKPNQLRSPVVAAHPWQLAQKRAEWQALRRAFPIGESEEESIET